MTQFNSIYKPGVLNIFTDASMSAETYNGYKIGCSGVELATTYQEREIIYNLYPTGYIPNYLVTLDTTNNNSELLAIRQGILFAVANKNRFKQINLFSDSLISIKALTEWIDGWFYKALKMRDPNFTLITSSNVPVSNQSIIKNIISLIYYNDLNIRFYHQRGHCLDNPKLAKLDFKKFNNIHPSVNVTDGFIEQISLINDIVDQRSRQIMKTFIKTGYAPYIINNTIIPGIEYDISGINFKRYKKLIGKGR